MIAEENPQGKAQCTVHSICSCLRVEPPTLQREAACHDTGPTSVSTSANASASALCVVPKVPVPAPRSADDAANSPL